MGLTMATLKNKNLFEDTQDIWLNEFRIELANALFQKGFNVYKARKDSDGEYPFGVDRFIVIIDLPTGNISKIYEIKDWDRFKIPEKEFADKQNEHSPRYVAKLTVSQRIRRLIKELL